MIPLRYGNSTWGRIHIVNRHAQRWTSNPLIGTAGANDVVDWIAGDNLMYGQNQWSGYVNNQWENQYVAWYTSYLNPGAEWCEVEVVVNMETGNKGVITAYPIVGGVQQNGASQFPAWLALDGEYSHS